MASDSAENEENPKRFSPQCFLLDFYKEFSETNADVSYENFVKINVEPSDVVNTLMNKGNAFALNDLTPAQMSNLVPKFRLYKIYADGKEKEFYFDDATSIENLGSGKTKTKRSKQATSEKIDAVGLKSFTWEDLGTNPANQGLSFKASLVVSCPTMQSLFIKSKNGLSFDELICPKGRNKTNENPEYVGKDNRIRADVGWSIPGSFSTTPEIWGTAKQRQKLKDAIRSSQVSLYLNLTQHELSINEDGTIELSVEFMASLEAGLFSPRSDLFQIEKKESEQVKASEALIRGWEKLKAGAQTSLDENIVKSPKESSWFGRLADRRAESNRFEKEISGYQEKIDEEKANLASFEREALMAKYRALITSITTKGRFFSLELTPGQRKAYKELNELYSRKTLTEADINTRRQQIIDRMRKENPSFRPNPLSQPPEGTSISSELTNIASSSSSTQRSEAATNRLSKKLNRAKDGKNKTINYIFLGDLLDAACGIVRQNQIKEGERPEMIWRFLLGQISMYDFENKCYRNINVADFPISWDYFQSFFLEKVIKPAKQKYNIRRFIKDVISELLVGSLSPVCFGKLAPETRTKVNTQVVTLPSYGDPDMPIPAGKEIYDKLQLGKLVKWGASTGNYHNYLFIYPQGSVNYKWEGNYQKDQDNNIIHLQIAADRGILKSVSFSRQDMPGQREANIQKTVDGGGEVGNLLFSNKYNAELSLFGNTLFTNGSTLYLDPRGLGIGGLNQSNSLAQKLGVGGYYNVIKVQNTIEAGKFETSVTTILQGLGNEKNKKANTVNGSHSPLNPSTIPQRSKKMDDPSVRPPIRTHKFG